MADIQINEEKLKEILDRLDALEQRRVSQSSIPPQIVKSRHLEENILLNSPYINEEVSLTATSTQINNVALGGVTTRLKSGIVTLTRDLSTATGDVTYTGLDFTPTSIKAIGVVDGTAFVSEGFSDSTLTSQCIYQYTDTGVNKWSYSAGLLAMSPTISAYQVATVKSYNSNGVTLTWTKTSTPTGTATIRLICYS